LADFSFTDTGIAAKLLAASINTPKECARAVYAEALVEAKESMRRTPVLTGAARASHEVVLNAEEQSASIVVGGPGLEYVIPLHENLEADHPNGQAKFLESTINESKPFMAARLAARLDLTKVVS
jgi:hypothetical protein